MEIVLHFFQSLLNFLDTHDGSVAMFGIAITVLIFRREVINNYFTLERENFNEIFKNTILKVIPERLAALEEAKGSEWELRFDDLMKVLDEAIEKAKYFKYAMPYFYSCLKESRDKIGDLKRHDNWREYRTSACQTFMVEKICRRIINTIIDASKGRVLGIRFSQCKPIKALRHFFERKFVERPIDRILECRVKASAYDYIEIRDSDNAVISSDQYKKYPSTEVVLRCKDKNMALRKVVAFVPTSKYYFGFLFNIRFGKHLGIIDVKAEKDGAVRCMGIKKLKIEDRTVHNILLLWSDLSNKRIQMYDVIKIKRQ